MDCRSQLQSHPAISPGLQQPQVSHTPFHQIRDGHFSAQTQEQLPTVFPIPAMVTPTECTQVPRTHMDFSFITYNHPERRLGSCCSYYPQEVIAIMPRITQTPYLATSIFWHHTLNPKLNFSFFKDRVCILAPSHIYHLQMSFLIQ